MVRCGFLLCAQLITPQSGRVVTTVETWLGVSLLWLSDGVQLAGRVETWPGVSLLCPSDGGQPAGRVETWPGVSLLWPSDGVQLAGRVETWPGVSLLCPSDGVQLAGRVETWSGVINLYADNASLCMGMCMDVPREVANVCVDNVYGYVLVCVCLWLCVGEADICMC